MGGLSDRMSARRVSSSSDAVFMTALLSLFYALGSEEGAVFPPVPWGVSAPGRVCLHGGHVALPLRLHHHVHRASQVRRGRRLTSSTRTSHVAPPTPVPRL